MATMSVDPNYKNNPYVQEVLAAYNAGMQPADIARAYNISVPLLQQILSNAGVNYSVPKSNVPTQYQQSTASGGGPGSKAPATPVDTTQPPPPGFKTWQDYYNYQRQLTQIAAGGAGGGGGGSAAADLAEKKREFDLTMQRDIAKENASEVDALQKMIAGMSGPKDPYGDLFFSHGLAAPQGYKPAPLPLTSAQINAYKQMGVSPKDLQAMLTGNGQPGADTGMLGNLGSSLQPQPGQPGYTQVDQSKIAPTGPSNPTQQGGALYGKAPAGSSVTGPAPSTPAMAGGGEVPGEVGDPRLVVAHGGEQIDNDTEQGELAPMNAGNVHPAIQKLMDALSELLANPDFQQFAGQAGKAVPEGKGKGKGKSAGPKQSPLDKMAPGPQVTPGGMQAMATGGTVSSGFSPRLNPPLPIKPSPVPNNPTPPSTITSPVGAADSAGTSYIAPHGRGTGGLGGIPNILPSQTGGPLGGAQAVTSFTGSGQPADQPVMPLAKMDPYTRALYDVHGRLHPYSAQQLQQMGPQGSAAVESYIGKVLGGDVNAYKDLAQRLMPQGAPTASDAGTGGGFKFG